MKLSVRKQVANGLVVFLLMPKAVATAEELFQAYSDGIRGFAADDDFDLLDGAKGTDSATVMVKKTSNLQDEDPTGGDPTGGDPTGGDPSGYDPSAFDPSGYDPSGGDPSGCPPSTAAPVPLQPATPAPLTPRAVHTPPDGRPLSPAQLERVMSDPDYKAFKESQGYVFP